LLLGFKSLCTNPVNISGDYCLQMFRRRPIVSLKHVISLMTRYHLCPISVKAFIDFSGSEPRS